MAITKPTVDTATWGNTNTSSPDMVTPAAGMVNTGFLAYPVKLKRGHLNWLINKLHQGLRYYMAQGMPAWDASEGQYAVGSVVYYSVTNKFYRLHTASPAGTAPSVDTAHWIDLMLISGLRLNRTVITTPGAFSFSKTAGCTLAVIRGVGCGGVGAGARGSNNPNNRAGGAGASGSWGEFETTTIPAVNWTGTIGAVGTAPSAPVVDDTFTQGTDSTSTAVSDGTNTYTFPAGGKADNAGNGGAPGAAPSASPGTGVTTKLAVPGEGGGAGMVSAGVVPISPVRSGKGGSCPFGGGGADRSDLNSAAGGAAGGYGGGGGGAASNSSTGRAGGACTGAYIEIIELIG